MPVTLVNVFKLPEDQRDKFLKCWTETTQVYARTEGFLETHVHENTGRVPDGGVAAVGNTKAH